jgi:hypothetical protein
MALKGLDKVASKLLGKVGGDVTIRYVSGGSYNTTTGVITETTSDTSVKGHVYDVSVNEANDLIQAGDKRLMVAADDLATAPETKDRVVISSIVYQSSCRTNSKHAAHPSAHLKSAVCWQVLGRSVSTTNT